MPKSVAAGASPIGRVGQFTPDEARRRCEHILGNVAHGRPPLTGLDGIVALTMKAFIDDEYKPWVMANRPRSAADSLSRANRCFSQWNQRGLNELTPVLIEKWKLARYEAGLKPATVLRDLSCLSAVLSRAVRFGKLETNPIARVDKPRLDRSPKVRYLSQEEEGRLRTSLANRDDEMRRARDSANVWRSERHQDLLPRLEHFGDHLTPAIIISMNTGLRRGELLALKWGDVDFAGRLLTINGGSAKNGNTRHLPLNADAATTLRSWRAQSKDLDKVFPVTTSFKTAWGSILTKAKITKFRWHDLRHHFASRLVQGGVPLNTVRDLLGHGSLAMTLRYAHLAPDQKREAVETLIARSGARAQREQPVI